MKNDALAATSNPVVGHLRLSMAVLPLLLALYLGMTSLLVANVKPDDAPDEAANIQYVKYLADNGHFPVFDWSQGANRIDYEYHQPPLYYLLCVPTWKLMPEPAKAYSCRVVSMMCCAGVVALVWFSLLELFPENRELRLLATGFAALLPLNQTVGATAGNDSLAGLICAAMFYLIARGATREWRHLDSIAMGALLGLGMLTKNTCLMLSPMALGAAWSFSARAQGNDKRAACQDALLVAVVAALVCGWWLVRNQLLYGDPFAAKVFDLAFSQTSPRPSAVIEATGVSIFEYIRALLLIMFCTMWDFFGGPNTAIKIVHPFNAHPSPEIIPALPAMLVCLSASILAFLGLVRRLQEPVAASPENRIALRYWSLGFGLIVLAWIQFNLIQYQAQARYIHPDMLPLALGFALGWQRIFVRPMARSVCAAIFAAILMGLTLWNAFGWRTMV